MRRRIVISLAEGRLVRDLLTNGFLDFILKTGHEITLVTPADRVPSFTRDWERPDLTFAHLYAYDDSRSLLSRSMRMRKRVARFGNGTLLDAWLHLERKVLFPEKSSYRKLFESVEPSLVVAT